jgi:hypothetical protein
VLPPPVNRRQHRLALLARHLQCGQAVERGGIHRVDPHAYFRRRQISKALVC